MKVRTLRNPYDKTTYPVSHRAYTRLTYDLKRSLILILLVVFHLVSEAQPLFPKMGTSTNISNVFKVSPLHLNSAIPTKERIFIVTRGSVALWTGSLVVLHKAWYADFPRSSFHFFNDNSEWNQMDKVGHVWTNYHISRLSTEMWKWTGISNTNSVILGGISGVAYGSIIEIQDGFSSEWGFSMGDMAANVAGAASFVSQELAWNEQRILIKLSYLPGRYSNSMQARSNELFGKFSPERILKDYNSQTYWASANLNSFFPGAGFPKWLNISVGYGSDGLLGGTENKWVDEFGNQYNLTDVPRIRNFYLAPDVDLTRIRTKSKFLNTFFYIFNSVKFPAPSLELNSKGKFRLNALN